MKKNCKLFVAIVILCLVALVLASCGKPDCSEGHTWDEGVVTTEAGCTDKGIKTFTCSVCGETKAEDIAPAHTEVVDAAVPATCTATGKTEGKHCSVCNTVIVAQKDVEKLAHTEVVDAAVPATCAAVGKTEGSHCSVCNTVIIAQNDIPALAHTFEVGVVVQPTCTEEGRAAASRCSVCGYVEGGDPIPAAGHTFVTISAVEASCTAPGRKAGRYCSVCAYKELGKPTIMLPHLLTTVYAKAPTCSAIGYAENGTICGDCGEWIKKPAEIPADPKRHTNIVDMDDAPATCAAPATTGGKKCADCETVIEPPLSYGDPLPHEFGASEALDPTCAAYGHIAGKRCKNCDAWEDTSEGAWIAKLPHTYDQPMDAPATGKTLALIGGMQCSVCGDIKERPKVDPNSIFVPYVDIDFNSDRGAEAIVDSRGNVTTSLFGASVRKFDELKHGRKIANDLDALHIGTSGDYALCTFTNITTPDEMKAFVEAGISVEAFYLMSKKGGNVQGVVCATQDGGWGVAENVGGQPYFITGKTSAGGFYNANVTATSASSSQALVHVVAVYDFAAKTQKLYINGVLNAQQPIQADFKVGVGQAFNSFCLGSDTIISGSGGDFYTPDMTMVDAKIYEVALNDAMAKKVYDKATENFVSTGDPSVDDPQGPATLPTAYADLELDSTANKISEKNDQAGTTSALVSTITGSVSVAKETIKHDGKVKEIDVLKISDNGYVLCELAKIAGKSDAAGFVNAGFSLEVFYKAKTNKQQGIACAATGNANERTAGGFGIAQNAAKNGAYFCMGNGTDWPAVAANNPKAYGPMTEYVHLVAVFGPDPADDTRMAIRLSVNGAPSASSVFSGDFNPLVLGGKDLSNKFILGSNFKSDGTVNTSYQTDGLDIADLKIYNVALSDEQIALAYETATEGFADPAPSTATLPEAYADIDFDSTKAVGSDKVAFEDEKIKVVLTGTGTDIQMVNESVRLGGKEKSMDVLKISKKGAYATCTLKGADDAAAMSALFGEGFTIEAFYKTATGNQQGIVCCATGGAKLADASEAKTAIGGFGIAQNTGNRGAYFVVGNGANWNNILKADNAKTRGAMSEYVHVVAVYAPDGDNGGYIMKMSVNGGEPVTKTFNGTFNPLIIKGVDVSNKFFLGANFDGDTTADSVAEKYLTDGLEIADVKIYDTALSDEQIDLAYKAASKDFNTKYSVTLPEAYSDIDFDDYDVSDSKNKVSFVKHGGVYLPTSVTHKGRTSTVKALATASGEYVDCTFTEFNTSEKMRTFAEAGFSVEAFYVLSNKTGAQGVICGCASNGGWGLAENAGAPYFIAAGTAQNASKSAYVQSNATAASSATELVHVVGVYDYEGKVMKIYVDGEYAGYVPSGKDDTIVGSFAPLSGSNFNMFCLGAGKGSTSFGSKGMTMVDAKIYDEVLTAEQVAVAYERAVDDVFGIDVYADFNFDVGPFIDAPQDNKNKISAFSADDLMTTANVTFNGKTKEKPVLYINQKGQYVFCEFAEFANNHGNGISGGLEKMQAFLDAGFTLEVLYQTKSKNQQGIVGCACGPEAGWGLAQKNDGGKVQSYFITGNGSSWNSTYPNASPTTSGNSGMAELAHVVVTYDGDNQSIYVNGKCQETTSNVGPINPVPDDGDGNEYFNKFLIGANFKGDDEGGISLDWASDGLIVAGLKIYSKALTESQVDRLYNQACEAF